MRQYGNLSFSRIYDAGHAAPAYQPETSFEVFARIMKGTSVSTGAPIDLSTYNTTGPLNSTHTNSLPKSPAPTCWVRNIPETCTTDQKNKIMEQEGFIINGILYDDASQMSSVTASMTPRKATTGVVVTSTTVVTGFYTATSTPTATRSSANPSFGFDSMTMLSVVLCISTYLLCL